MGKCAIKQHATYKTHLNNLESVSQENQEDQQIAVQIEKETINNIDDCISRAEIFWSLLCVEHDLSFLVNDHASHMFSKMFQDSPTAAGYKSCRTKTRYTITHGTYETFKTQLNTKLNENSFLLQIDESNKIYGK